MYFNGLYMLPMCIIIEYKYHQYVVLCNVYVTDVYYLEWLNLFSGSLDFFCLSRKLRLEGVSHSTNPLLWTVELRLICKKNKSAMELSDGIFLNCYLGQKL